MKHRKLFPAFSANQSLDCPDFCDPACPYNCPYPDFYFLPPPPPPPPHSALAHHLPLSAIIIVSSLAGLFLLLTYYFLIARSCCRTNRPNGGGDTEEQFAGESRVDHPVWLIATVGLRPSVINSITVCKYKKSEGLVEGTECSVCLTEFQEEETLRIMPKCNHAFHIPCIDTWLTSHTNCPLCRATIVSETPGGAAGADRDTTTSTDSVNVAGTEDEAEVVDNKEGVDGDDIQQQPLRSLISSSCATGSGSGSGSDVESS